jgi:hypothetical protein
VSTQTQDALLRAEAEARYAAQKAREVAQLFEEYAELLALTAPWGKAARQKRLQAADALRLLGEAVESSDGWAAKAAGAGPEEGGKR